MAYCTVYPKQKRFQDAHLRVRVFRSVAKFEHIIGQPIQSLQRNVWEVDLVPVTSDIQLAYSQSFFPYTFICNTQGENVKRYTTFGDGIIVCHAQIFFLKTIKENMQLTSEYSSLELANVYPLFRLVYKWKELRGMIKYKIRQIFLQFQWLH